MRYLYSLSSVVERYETIIGKNDKIAMTKEDRLEFPLDNMWNKYIHFQTSGYGTRRNFLSNFKVFASKWHNINLLIMVGTLLNSCNFRPNAPILFKFL